ncbi:hypothetical protein E2C01_012600 [Portunus trituberculatus]|uniref:Uncharacterized protein n=1 Tax=Portunus trituberculatus TaxID=210409 RepID=A0A5B7DF55_PORTR|nr:hypothetical protein [Portunus trituberculatus]
MIQQHTTSADTPAQIHYVHRCNHVCFGVRGISKRTGSNPVHGPSVDDLATNLEKLRVASEETNCEPFEKLINQLHNLVM